MNCFCLFSQCFLRRRTGSLGITSQWLLCHRRLAEASARVQLQWPFCPGRAWGKAAGFEQGLTQLPTSRGAHPPAPRSSRADTSAGAPACCAQLRIPCTRNGSSECSEGAIIQELLGPGRNPETLGSKL